MKKLYKTCILIILFISILTFPTDSYCEENNEYEYYTSVIIELNKESKEGMIIYKIKSKFTEGPYENQTIELEYIPVLGTSRDIEFKKRNVPNPLFAIHQRKY